jgi:hypothetical protein
MTNYTMTISPERFSMRVLGNDDKFQAQSGVFQSTGRSGNRWMLSCTWRRPGAEYLALRGEVGRLQGVRNRAVIPMSLLGRVRGGVGGGTPQVNGAHTAGAVTLAVKGMPISTTGVLLAGDCLQVGNQLVEVVTQLNSDGSGNGSCNVWPELHLSYANSTAIVYTTSASGVFIMVSDYEIGSESFGGDWFGEMAVDFMEDVLA